MSNSKSAASVGANIGSFATGAVVAVLSWTLFCSGPVSRRAASGGDAVLNLFILGLPVVTVVGGVLALVIFRRLLDTKYIAALKYCTLLIWVVFLLSVFLRIK